LTADQLHHEDLPVGDPFIFDSKEVTKEEIVAFARAYDPQPMHLDEAAAKASPAGGLTASGLHVCGIMMRMVCDGLLSRVASLGSPGVDEVNWKEPVRPGDVVSTHYTIQEKRVLASRPDVGIAKVLVELRKEGGGEVAASWLTNQLTRVRNPAAASSAAPRASRPRPPIASLWDGPSPPVPSREAAFFEDREVGEVVDLEPYTFAKDEMIAFARAFDPQAFHLDEAAARQSLFGALSASGWFTAAVYVRGIATARLKAAEAARARGERPAAFGPSPGLRDLRWPKPVFAGDAIAFRSRLARKIDLGLPSRHGLLESEVQGRNQNGEIVLALTSQTLDERREPQRP
jgi:acyl dehydratase